MHIYHSDAQCLVTLPYLYIWFWPTLHIYLSVCTFIWTVTNYLVFWWHANALFCTVHLLREGYSGLLHACYNYRIQVVDGNKLPTPSSPLLLQEWNELHHLQVRTLPYLMWRVVSLPGCTLLWAFPAPLEARPLCHWVITESSRSVVQGVVSKYLISQLMPAARSNSTSRCSQM